MSDGIPPLLVLLMWNLLFTGDEPMMSKAKPGVDKKKLKPLLDAGLIVLEKRGRANHLVLTDRAWQWAEEHLDAEFSPRANATPALAGILPRLKNYLKQTGTPLAELLSAEEAEYEEGADVPAGDGGAAPAQVSIDESIRRAYLARSGNRWEIRVRLAQLREDLGAYAREEQDLALLRMQSEGRLVLYRLDDPQDTFEADRAAALYLGGDPRHLVYMKG
ncbi:MAG: hypothetical protein L3K26_15255 [Candidatus Hydrogenedentes bacterium]|nr:hypothetical protein [Candidatus Hydrogenedentota bacterium]